jgi:hypothetical protein
MNRNGVNGYGLVSYGALLTAVLAAGCSGKEQGKEQEGIAATKASLEPQAPPEETVDLAFRITGVRAPASNILNSASAVRMNMRTTFDDSTFIGSQDFFICGTAFGPTFSGGVPCNQGGLARFHAYPAYANSILASNSSSPRPDVYLRRETIPAGAPTASIDVSFGLSPTGSNPNSLTVFTSSSGSFRLNVDLATGAVEPALGQIAGAACGFRREDGTTGGSCPRTCSPTSGPECRQNCLFLQGGSGANWEVCYEVDVVQVSTTTTRAPCLPQTILYEPAGNESIVSMGSETTIGSRKEWSVTTTGSRVEGLNGSVTVLQGQSDFEDSWSNTTGGSTTTERSTFTGLGLEGGLDAPDHANNDLFVLACGALVTTVARSDGGLNHTVDLAQATFADLRGNQLRALTQSPRVPENFNLIPAQYRDALATYLSPALALEIMNLDPFVSGENIAQNTTRFERAVPASILLQGPTLPDQGPVHAIRELSIARGSETTEGTGYTTAQSTGVGIDFDLEIEDISVGGGGSITESFGVEYESVKANSRMDEVTYSLDLATSTLCVDAPVTLAVDVFFDNAFGSYLTIPTLTNPCVNQPFRTMSFENLGDWQFQSGGSAALSNVIVSGARSFSISTVGWTPFVSRPLSSALLRSVAKSSDLSKMSFALRIPTSQPNPYWIGAAQMYVTAPSANVYSAYMGQVELTPLPKGEFVRLGYTIPAYALHALTGNHEDVSFTIVLNVNAGTTGWLVDDLVLGR